MDEIAIDCLYIAFVAWLTCIFLEGMLKLSDEMHMDQQSHKDPTKLLLRHIDPTTKVSTSVHPFRVHDGCQRRGASRLLKDAHHTCGILQVDLNNERAKTERTSVHHRPTANAR